MSVNVFIVNRDGVSRDADMNICLMIRDICVFGCECGADAVALAESVVPELVFFRIFPEDRDVFAVIRRLLEIRPASVIAVAAFFNDTDGELEKKCRAAGASSFFSEDLSDDNFLYAIKNHTDIIRSKKEKKLADKDAITSDEKFCSFITEVLGYNDILSMNKRFGNLKHGLSGNIVYIRVLSFLYDFLVKCFLSDIKITIGTAADKRRIIVLFKCDENIINIAKEAVFYSVAEKYITSDGTFCRIYMAIDADEFKSSAGMPDFIEKRRAPFNLSSEVLFETMLDDIISGNLARLRETVDFFAEFIDIFSPLCDFLLSYLPSCELEVYRDCLANVLKNLDTALAKVLELSKGKEHDAEMFGVESDLYEAVLRLQLILYTYRRI